jgi:hypothetical protein
MRPSAAADEGTLAGKEQDAPITVLHHRLDDGTGEVQSAVEDNSSDRFPILRRQLGERLVRPDGGIVDQDVDSAELGQRPRRHFLDLVLAGDVGNHGDRLDAEALGFVHDGVGLGLVGAGIDNDVCALPSQPQHGRAADVAARSGYQRNLALKLSHEISPFRHARTDVASRSPTTNSACVAVFFSPHAWK